MARFSVGGDEGEGSGGPTPKRIRFTPRFTIRCNSSDSRSRLPQLLEDRAPSRGSGYVDLEGEGSGDEILGSDADRRGDVDDDDDEEEGGDDREDETRGGEEELDPVGRDSALRGVVGRNLQSIKGRWRRKTRERKKAGWCLFYCFRYGGSDRRDGTLYLCRTSLRDPKRPRSV